MIEYEVSEINKGHFIKILKCTSSSMPNKKLPVKPKRKPVIVIIPGSF